MARLDAGDETDAEEIFAVSVLPDIRFPELTNNNSALTGDLFVLPNGILEDVPVRLRSSTARRLSAALGRIIGLRKSRNVPRIQYRFMVPDSISDPIEMDC